jgi:hypothetical protein
LKGDIIDACIDACRTIIDRCPGQYGDSVLLYAKDSVVTFELAQAVSVSWPEAEISGSEFRDGQISL